MKNVFKGLLMLLIFILFFSCSKDSPSSTETPTTLKIIVKDDSGSPVSQAQVKLYGSQSDMNNNLNQILTTQTTDATGETSFSPVTSYQNYYWLASKDCRTNLYSTTYNQLFLQSNTTTSYSTTISGTGILKFINTSTNPYNVFINNTLEISNMNGGITKSYNFPSGSYTIRVEQQSGYLFSPTIETFNTTLTCGGTATTTFP